MSPCNTACFSPNSILCALLSMIAVVGSTGCATKKPKSPTPLYGARTSIDNTAGPNTLTNIPPTNPPLEVGTGIPVRPLVVPGVITNPPLFPPTTSTTNGVGSQNGPEIIDGHAADRAIFAASTVYFDYDKAVLKAAELGKLQPVIAALKAAPQNKLRIEGHCDERGTEEYNRALGERRALAIRDFIIRSGKIAPNRVTTTSFGEDKPAELGHDEAAWAKNRRSEIVLLKPQN